MKKFGLIGYPIATSGSPALFRAGYGGRYSYDLIEEPDFATAFDRFVAGYDGINVTAPFKIDAFRKADIWLFGGSPEMVKWHRFLANI